MKPVLVTTTMQAVFFGYLEEDASPASVTLTDARVAVYWDSGVRGFLGLASDGPSDKCRISPKVARVKLQGITTVTDCSPEAVEAWEAAPWATSN